MDGTTVLLGTEGAWNRASGNGEFGGDHLAIPP
jgi:hypothetical protein